MLSIDHISGQADFDCGLSDPVCQLSDLNGVYMNPIYSDQNPFFNTPICNGNIRISNAIWFSFVAPSTSISFNVSNINCDLPTPQIAGCSSACLKIGFWSDCDATCFNLEDPQCYNSTVITTNNFFDIGNRYYLIIDGVCGSVCSFKLDVNANQTNSLEIPNCNEVAIDVVAEDPFCINNGANNVCIGSKVGIKATGSNGFMNMEDLSQAAWSWKVTGPANVLWTEPLSSRSGDGQDITYGSVDFDSEKGGNEFEITFQEAGIYAICLLDYQTYCDSFSGCDGSLCVEVDVQDCVNYVHPDYDQLIDLYSSTNGGSWTNNDGWKEGAEGTSCDPCDFNGGTWYGIECTNGRVTCIDLDGKVDCNENQLSSSGNNLIGTLPKMAMDELIFFSIRSNLVRDTFPDLDCPELVFLTIDSNLFTFLDTDFDKLLNLRVFYSRSNLFENLPDFQCPELRQIDLENNNIKSNLPDFTGIPKLSAMTLRDNSIVGIIPNFSNLQQLNNFDASNNSLIGEIPEFSQCPLIGRIVLDNNELEGCYPDIVCELFDFNRFSSDNNLQLPWQGDHIPFCNGEDEIGAPCDDNNPLTTDDQIQNDCSCSGIPEDCTHPDYNALLDLYISTNGDNWTNTVNGDRPWDLSCDPCDGSWFGIECNNSRVSIIKIDDNNLNGEIPNLDLPNLQRLGLSDNLLIGQIPDFNNLQKLESLSLGRNRLSGEIPNFQFLDSLNSLQMGVNLFTGNLPNFSNLSNLTIINIFGTTLSGEIPDYSHLTKLRILYIFGNQLSGCFPEYICDIEEFDSSSNFHLPNNGDHNPFCSGNNQIGAPCDDLDPSTDNDVIQPDCSCKGESQDCIHPDYNALIELYTSTNGDNWTNSVNGDNPWDQSCDPCDGSWYGIECDDNRVTCIDLDGNPNCTLDTIGNNLMGIIPNFILNELQILILSGNENISGDLPNLDSLINVEVLRCDNCSLSGNLPNFNLPSLKVLSISNNDLSGVLPEMNLLPNVEFIRLNENAFEGTIPEFSGNPLLNRIRLQDNNLSGCFPSTICNISDISYINNPLLPWQGDHFPLCNGEEQVGAPCDDNNPLTTDDQIQNDCSCSGDTQDCNHPDYDALMELYVSTRGINWIINNGWKEGAEGTSCDPCNFNGETWYGIECLNGRVSSLQMGSNNLNGPLTTLQLDSLVILRLQNNDLTGTIPPFGQFKKLEFFGLNFNKISGEIPSLDNNKNLVSVFLDYNLLTGEIPQLNGLNLSTFSISNNLLSGNIPSFNDVNNLEAFQCNGNFLTDTIPDLINMPLLFIFNCENNLLTGELPKLEQLPNLSTFASSGNNLTGNIPVINELSSLSYFGIADNDIAGCYNLSLCDIPNFDSSNNPKLPNQGDHIPFCNGEEQVGAPCDDNNPLTTNDQIQNDCSCIGTTTTPDDQIPGCEIVPQCDLGEFDGVIFLTPNYSTQNPQYGEPLCMGVELIENALAFPFVAGDTSLNISITVTNCELPANAPCNSEGVAVALWTDCSGSCEGEMIPIPNNGFNEITLSNLIIGNPYYLIVDGQCGSMCNVELNIASNTDWSFDIPNASEISVTSSVDQRGGCDEIAPNVFCPGQEVFFFAEGDNGVFDMDDIGAAFSWTISGPNSENVDWDAVIDSGEGPNISYGTVGVDNAELGGNIVAMVFHDVGIYEICLTEVSTYCDVSINGEVCHSITIINLDQQDFGEYDLCYTAMAIDGDEFTPPTFSDPASGITYEWSNGASIGISEILSSNGVLTDVTGDCCLIEQVIQINLVGSIDPGVVEIPLYECQLPYSYDVNGQTIVIDDIDSFNNFNEQLFGASGAQDYNGNSCDSLVTINASRILLADSISIDYLDNEAEVLVDIYRVDGEDFTLINGEYIWRDALTNIIVATGNPVLLPSGSYICEYNGMIIDVLTGSNSACSGLLGPYEISITEPDCFFDLQNDLIETQFNTPTQINVLTNDSYPSGSVFTVIEYDNGLIDFTEIGDVGFLDFTVIGNFSDTIKVTYEICDSSCSECHSAILSIVNEDLADLTLTNIISPNDDGSNDILRFNNESLLPDSKLTIFNRWGDAVFTTENYENDWSADGIPGGIYFYVLEVYGLTIKRTLTVFK